jgi:hypothetical protein
MMLEVDLVVVIKLNVEFLDGDHLLINRGQTDQKKDGILGV